MAKARGTMVERTPGVRRLRVFARRDADGRPIQVSRAFRGGRRAAQVAEQGSPVTSNMTVGEMLDKWLAFVTPLREPGTIRGYQSHASRAKKRLDHIKFTRLTAQHLDRAYSAWLPRASPPPRSTTSMRL